jgi:hypothetical protein
MNDTTPPNEMTHICKEDLYSRSASLVPNFAARWHLFCKHFFTSKINHNTKQTKEPTVQKITHLHLKKKVPTTRKSRSKATKSQNHLKKEQHNGQLVLVAVDATSGPAHIKFL